MSYILDALRKSEQERQPGTPVRPDGPVHNISVPWRGGWLLVVGIILLLVFLAAAIVFWHYTVNGVSSEPAVAVTIPSTATVTAPSTTEPVAVVPPPVTTVMSEPAVRDLAEQARVPASFLVKVMAYAPGVDFTGLLPEIQAPTLMMGGSAARIAWNAADRLIAIIASHRSGGNSCTGAVN